MKRNVVSITRSVFFTYKSHDNLPLNLRLRILENKKTLGKSQKFIGKQLSVQYPLKKAKKSLEEIIVLVLKKYTKTGINVFRSCIVLFDFLTFFPNSLQMIAQILNCFTKPVVKTKYTFSADITNQLLHGMLVYGRLKNIFLIVVCFFSNGRVFSTSANISYDIVMRGYKIEQC